MSITALLIQLGAIAPAFAQEKHHGEAAKPAEQEASEACKARSH